MFGNQQGANTNDSIKAIAKEITPKLTAHWDAINLNDKLFERIKTVYNNKEKENLTPEQLTVLDKYYQGFVRGGANLSPEDKETFKKLNSELSMLSLQFGENLLNETNNFKLVIDNKQDLSGLPENVIATAATAAKNAGWRENGCLPPQSKHDPFLQYADNRDLREKSIRLISTVVTTTTSTITKKSYPRSLPASTKAQLLGYDTHAAFILDNNMAKPRRTYDLCTKSGMPLSRSLKRSQRTQDMVRKEGKNFKLQPWDWRYYAEK
ncbi:MAG: M3 family metallopeptidase [Butyricimonas faecihominis]